MMMMMMMKSPVSCLIHTATENVETVLDIFIAGVLVLLSESSKI